MTTEQHPYPRLYADGLKRGGMYLGNPVWRTIEMEHAMSLMQMNQVAFNLGINYWNMPIVNDALIQRSRSTAASDFLRTDCSVLVMIDSDIAFGPEDVFKIAEKAYDYSIVGGAYVKRMPGTRAELAVWMPAGVQVDFVDDAEVVEVGYLSGGFMAIHRRVFEAILEKFGDELPLCESPDGKGFYPFFRDRTKKIEGMNHEMFLSEDWAVQELAHQCGFKSYLDGSVRLGHVGNYTFTYEDMIRPPRLSPRAIRYTKGANGKALVQGQILDSDDGAITNYYKPAAFEEVVTTADGFRMQLMTDDAMISQEIAMTGYWEKPVRDEILKHLRATDVFLDVGANIGYFSLLVASKGNYVVVVEPMPKALECLHKSIELNQLGHTMEVREWAAAGKDRKYTLVTEGLNNQGEAHLSLLNEKRGPTVQGHTLDFIGLQPDIIKIDIEGEEWNVITASPEIFSRARVIIFEVSDAQLKRNSQHGANDLLDWFYSEGFEVLKISEHNTYSDWVAIRPGV